MTFHTLCLVLLPIQFVMFFDASEPRCVLPPVAPNICTFLPQITGTFLSFVNPSSLYHSSLTMSTDILLWYSVCWTPWTRDRAIIELTSILVFSLASESVLRRQVVCVSSVAMRASLKTHLHLVLVRIENVLHCCLTSVWLTSRYVLAGLHSRSRHKIFPSIFEGERWNHIKNIFLHYRELEWVIEKPEKLHDSCVYRERACSGNIQIWSRLRIWVAAVLVVPCVSPRSLTELKGNILFMEYLCIEDTHNPFLRMTRTKASDPLICLWETVRLSISKVYRLDIAGYF